MAGTDKDEYASTSTMRRNTARDGQEHQGLHGYTIAELLDSRSRRPHERTGPACHDDQHQG